MLGLQHPRTQAVLSQDFRDGLHGGAVQRDVAQDQRMGAGSAAPAPSGALTASSAVSRSSSGVHSVP